MFGKFHGNEFCCNKTLSKSCNVENYHKSSMKPPGGGACLILDLLEGGLIERGAS